MHRAAPRPFYPVRSLGYLGGRGTSLSVTVNQWKAVPMRIFLGLTR